MNHYCVTLRSREVEIRVPVDAETAQDAVYMATLNNSPEPSKNVFVVKVEGAMTEKQERLAELRTIDDALDLAGAPKAETRVGRIRMWMEKTRNEAIWKAAQTEPGTLNAQAAQGVLTEEERKRIFCNSYSDFINPRTYEENAGDKRLVATLESAVLRRVAEMVEADAMHSDPSELRCPAMKSFATYLRRCAGDKP